MVTQASWERMTEPQKRRALAAAKRRPLALCTHPAWPLLLRIARERGWPAAFEADLYVHDVAVMSIASRERPFLWAIGETGTSLVFCDAFQARTRDEAAELVATFEDQRPVMHHWDGRTLWRCTPQDARAVLRGVRWGDLDNYY